MSVEESADWLDLCRVVADEPVDAFMARMEAMPEAQQKALLRARFRYDRMGFIKFCWPDRAYRPFNPYHAWIFSPRKMHHLTRLRLRRGAKDAQAAPRGFAKSTGEMFDCAHDCAYGLEGYIVVVQVRKDDAIGWGKSLRALLTESEPFAWLYGTPTITAGKTEYTVTVGSNVTPFRFSSRGIAIRGTQVNNQRPTKIVFDDAEDRIRVLNPKLREEDAKFITDDALKAGPREKNLLVRWRGTVLHPEAQLAMMLDHKSPHAGWSARKWKAVKSWPTRADLWDAAGRICTNLSLRPSPAQLRALRAEHEDADMEQLILLHRVALARQFYEANRDAMDEGAEVLDEHAMPLFDVYTIVWLEGWASVWRELQNEPRDPNSQVFWRERCTRHRRIVDHRGIVIVAADKREIPLSTCRLMGRWDPTPGVSLSGDFAAVAVMAKDPMGYRYLLPVWMRRASPTEQLEACWQMSEQFGCSKFKMESNGFQRLLDDQHPAEVARRASLGRYADLRLDPVVTTENKEMAIGAMELPVQNGWLSFDEELSEDFWSQLENWRSDGSAAHDDGIEVAAKLFVDLGGTTPGLVADPNRRMT